MGKAVRSDRIGHSLSKKLSVGDGQDGLTGSRLFNGADLFGGPKKMENFPPLGD